MTAWVRFLRGRDWSALILSALIVSVSCVTAFAQVDNYIFTDRNADAYALTKNYVSFSTNVTGDDILTLNQMFGGNYLWVRRGGKEFVIRDHNALKDANLRFAPFAEVEREQIDLQKARAQFEKDLTALDTEGADLERRLARLDKSEKSSRARESLESKLAELSVRRTQLDGIAADLDAKESALQARVKSLALQIETSMWAFVDEALARGLGVDERRWGGN